MLSRLLGHPRKTMIVIGLVTVLAGFSALQIGFDGAIESWFLDDDPTLMGFRKFQETFQIDENGVVGVFADDVFAPHVMAAVERITRAIANAPHVRRVRSITNLKVVKGDGGFIERSPLYERPPPSAAEAQALRRRVLDHPLAAGHFVSGDGRGAAVVYELTPQGQDPMARDAFVAAVNRIVCRETTGGIQVFHAGTAPLADAMVDYCQRDLAVLGPITFIVVGLIVWFTFRRLSSALIALAAVQVALVWTFGVMGALGVAVNVISVTLVGLIVAIGVADAIHFLSRYHRRIWLGDRRKQAITRSARELLSPCLFTSITTAGGLLALLISDLTPLRQFGCFGALGVGLAFVLTMTLVPVLLVVAPVPAPSPVSTRVGLGWLLPLLEGAYTRHRLAVLLATAVVLVGAAGLLTRLTVGSDSVKYLRADNPVRRSIEAVDERLGGSMLVEVVARAPGGLLDPEILRRLDRTQEWVGAHPVVKGTLSVLDPLKQLNRAVAQGSTSLPGSRQRATQLMMMMMIEGDGSLDALVRSNHTVGRVMARVKLTEVPKIGRALPVLEAELQKRSGDGLQLGLTGRAPLLSHMEQYLLRSQLRSFILAVVVVMALMVLFLRSATLVLLALIPNLAPILVGLGLMALTGIGLNMCTVMISTLAIGIAIDDTVHLLLRLRVRVRQQPSLRQALRAALEDTAHPIAVTSVVLAAGFAVLVLASFVPNVHFGIISAAVVLLALLADLVVLPAVLLTLRPRLCRGAERVDGAPVALCRDAPSTVEV